MQQQIAMNWTREPQQWRESDLSHLELYRELNNTSKKIGKSVINIQ